MVYNLNTDLVNLPSNQIPGTAMRIEHLSLLECCKAGSNATDTINIDYYAKRGIDSSMLVAIYTDPLQQLLVMIFGPLEHPLDSTR